MILPVTSEGSRRGRKTWLGESQQTGSQTSDGEVRTAGQQTIPETLGEENTPTTSEPRAEQQSRFQLEEHAALTFHATHLYHADRNHNPVQIPRLVKVW